MIEKADKQTEIVECRFCNVLTPINWAKTENCQLGWAETTRSFFLIRKVYIYIYLFIYILDFELFSLVVKKQYFQIKKIIIEIDIDSSRVLSETLEFL